MVEIVKKYFSDIHIAGSNVDICCSECYIFVIHLFNEMR